MSISGALNNAVSGLRVAGRASQVISSNLANALTPGYGARSLELSASIIGGGARVESMVRNVDPLLLADRRIASAAFGQQQTTANFLNEIERLLGTPDKPSSLAARFSSFENTLITAASRPDSQDRLTNSINAARDLAETINKSSKNIQEQRSRADTAIGDQVKRLNDALFELQELNGQITSATIRGSEDAALRDLRQGIIDEISEIVPVRTVPRDRGQVAIYTTGGATLLDGRAAVIEFEQVHTVVAGMSIDLGSLNSLTVNGLTINTSTENGRFSGGSLAAQFKIRDELAPDAQAQLDAVARDLIERFADPGVDPTLGVGDAGLFTDSGNSFDPLDEVGLSARLELNVAVDPREGGESWRLRDGIGAVAPGNSGNASLLNALGDALTTARPPATGNFGSGSYSANGLVTSMMSQISSERANSDQHLTFASTVLSELKIQELNEGVDSDAELQRLMIVEQAYAANARVLQAADEMLQTLIRAI